MKSKLPSLEIYSVRKTSVSPFLAQHCKLEAMSSSQKGHTFSSDLTPVPFFLLRAHLSIPHISMYARLHYGEEGFDES